MVCRDLLKLLRYCVAVHILIEAQGPMDLFSTMSLAVTPAPAQRPVANQRPLRAAYTALAAVSLVGALPAVVHGELRRRDQGVDE